MPWSGCDNRGSGTDHDCPLTLDSTAMLPHGHGQTRQSPQDDSSQPDTRTGESHAGNYPPGALQYNPGTPQYYPYGTNFPYAPGVAAPVFYGYPGCPVRSAHPHQGYSPQPAAHSPVMDRQTVMSTTPAADRQARYVNGQLPSTPASISRQRGQHKNDSAMDYWYQPARVAASPTLVARDVQVRIGHVLRSSLYFIFVILHVEFTVRKRTMSDQTLKAK